MNSDEITIEQSHQLDNSRLGGFGDGRPMLLDDGEPAIRSGCPCQKWSTHQKTLCGYLAGNLLDCGGIDRLNLSTTITTPPGVVVS